MDHSRSRRKDHRHPIRKEEWEEGKRGILLEREKGRKGEGENKKRHTKDEVFFCPSLLVLDTSNRFSPSPLLPFSFFFRPCPLE
jgi:hypothetical protein